MPKKVSDGERLRIADEVARFPGGISVQQLCDSPGIHFPRRTLQRRLSELVKRGELIAIGQGRGCRYIAPRNPIRSSNVLRESTPELPGRAGITLSPEGEAILQAVHQPIPARHPVGYQYGFLDGYRPNETHYLSAELRQRLSRIGQSPGDPLPAGTYARKVLDRLLIDLSWNSSRLEGNTYSLLETERLLEAGAFEDEKNGKEAQMILNHKDAIELLVDQAGEIGFNHYTLLNLHALLSYNLLENPRASGRVRSIPVMIGGTVYHPPDPAVLEAYFQQMTDTVAAVEDPFEQAFFIMVHLPYLQPFEDANKRVSRLAANISLIRQNLSPLSFVDMPRALYIDGLLGIYEQNRIELLRDVFVWAYERSCARYAAVRLTLGEPDPFRLRYRSLLIETIGGVVRDRMSKDQADIFIKQQAKQKTKSEDFERFVEVAETEIMALHEGNFARFRIRPSEFTAWKTSWR